jgi:site-specific recombinase XerD
MSNEELLHKFKVYLLTEKRVTINTFNAYKSDIEQLLVFLKTKDQKLSDVTPKELKAFLKYLHQSSINPRSISRKISSLKTFFLYLQQQGLAQNSAKELRLPKIEKKLPHYLSEEEVKQLFDVADKDTSAHGLRNRVMLYLLYASGMRVSELTSLTLADIHFDTSFIAVAGKGGKHRLIPLPQSMLKIIQEYIDTQLKSEEQSKKSHGSYLFPTRYAGKIKPMSRQSFWIILKELWRKTGSKRTISPHQLRHSLATHMLKSGVDLRSLQLILGHENLATVQIYTHVEKSYVRKIYDSKHPRS